MFQLVAIVDASFVIRAGLAALLRDNDLCRQIGLLESLDEWNSAFPGTQPDLLLVSPEQWRHGLGKKARDIPAVGLIYQYCDRETLSQFTDTIYITDPEEAIVEKLRHLQGQSAGHAAEAHLTAREKEVLRCLVKGLSNKEVADKLHISTHTAIAHRKSIVEKTGIHSLAGLAVYALLNNISEIGELCP